MFGYFIHFFLAFVNYWGGEVQLGHVSHTSANYSPEMAANPHPPWPGICPPRPYPAQPSTLGPKLMLKASLTEQYKSSSAYDLSLLRLKLDILYAQPQTPTLISPIALFQQFQSNPLTHSLIPFPSFSTQSPFFS